VALCAGGGVANGAAGNGTRVPQHGRCAGPVPKRAPPALAFQEHLETLDRLSRAGKIRGTKDPRSLIYMSMSAVEHRPDVPVKPPQWMMKALAFVGRRLGYTLDDGTPREEEVS
jgi:hypothetical protein